MNRREVIAGHREATLAFPARLYRVFIAIAVLALGIAVVLSATTLWNGVETYCGRVFDKQYQGDGGCDAVTSGRMHWVVVMALLAVAFGIAGVLAYRRRPPLPRTPLVALTVALLTTSIVAAVFATLFLARGSNDNSCGSTLSRITYDQQDCVGGWASARHRAWVAGSISAATLIVATALEMSVPPSAGPSLRKRSPKAA